MTAKQLGVGHGPQVAGRQAGRAAGVVPAPERRHHPRVPQGRLRIESDEVHACSLAQRLRATGGSWAI